MFLKCLNQNETWRNQYALISLFSVVEIRKKQPNSLTFNICYFLLIKTNLMSSISVILCFASALMVQKQNKFLRKTVQAQEIKETIIADSVSWILFMCSYVMFPHWLRSPETALAKLSISDWFVFYCCIYKLNNSNKKQGFNQHS